MNISVLFLVFNRFSVTKKVFQQIAKAKPHKLYIASDGARNDVVDEDEKVQEVRDYLLSNIHWECEVKTLFRKKNLGCRIAVSSAIDWFFENEEMGIILEDDCLPTQSFFPFCEQLLIKYKNDTRVMHIGGLNLLNSYSENIEYEALYYFSKDIHIWGWATWARAWKYYDVEMSDLELFKKQNKIKDIFCYETLFRRTFLNAFTHIKYNNIDTWDCQWSYALLKNSSLSITPSKNLIKNIGHSPDATHTKDENSFYANMEAYDMDTDSLSHPSFMLIDSKIDLCAYRYTILRIIKEKLKNLIGFLK